MAEELRSTGINGGLEERLIKYVFSFLTNDQVNE